MFGMTNENQENDAGLLTRLEELLKRYSDGDVPLHGAFTEDEMAALKRVAARERAYMAIGAFGSSLKTILTYLGFFIGIYVAFKTGVIEWIRSIPGR